MSEADLANGVGVGAGARGVATASGPRGGPEGSRRGGHPWFREAVIYEVHVRAFCDSDGDGVGDFRGLTSKLEYLQSLGVTAIWLLPFYPSPLRDDGYDIADYTGVNPAYGTIEDFEHFVDEAHRIGLRVITELVINHTSDRHPWFERARRAPAGSAERDFYVWSDTDERYADARIIFQDFEDSNWTWDEEAGAYFWHRFYHHQPDLNFENGAVHDAVMDVMDFWFDRGVDGMRLDAVPYLYEEEGTNCENLPETHVFLKKLRAHLDEKYEDKMLLAEANQWPEDAAAYFGDGDECHMNFHFPIMPRLFMALRMEDRFPIVDIMEQTPPAPEGCQWALFLRNHDELTLEMVTDEERDYMYRSYASDHRARVNVGIRRRLAPLLDNNRRKIELLHGLLFSLPGTPVLYYGDEIGMGDNYTLGDRDAVRTPMQWSGERNAGFSDAAGGGLYLPVVEDAGFHFEAVNVAEQVKTPSSLLWWMRRTLGLRRRHPVFGTGSMRPVRCSNPKVLAFVREGGGETVLVLANLSRFTHAAEVDLSEFVGRRVVEMFGGAEFPPVREEPNVYTLGPHGFMWLLLKEPEADGVAFAHGGGEPEEVSTEDDPVSWLTTKSARRWISDWYGASGGRQPWLDHQVRGVRELEVVDALPVPLGEGAVVSAAAVLILRVRFSGSEFGTFATLAALAGAEHAARVGGRVMATVRHRSQRSSLTLYEAVHDPEVTRGVYELIRGERELRGTSGSMAGRVFGEAVAEGALPEASELPAWGGSGRDALGPSACAFGESFVLKLVGRDRPASEASTEVVRHLSRQRCVAAGAGGGVEDGFGSSPVAYGELAYTDGAQGRRVPVALLGGYIAHESSARELVVDGVNRYVEELLGQEELSGLGAAPEATRPLIEAGALPSPGTAPAVFERDREIAEVFGERLGQLHAALACPGDWGGSFEPEAFGKLTLRASYQSMRNTAIPALRSLSEALPTLGPASREAGRELLEKEGELLRQLKLVSEAAIDSVRIRCYGQLELEHVLWTGRDFVFTEFESDPRRRLAETRLKHPPLRDVAALLTDMARTASLVARERAQTGTVPASSALAGGGRSWAGYWWAVMSVTLLGGYTRAVRDARPDLLPSDPVGLSVLFHAEMLERAAWRLHLSLVRRPGEVGSAIRFLRRLVDTPPSVEPTETAPATHPSAG